MKHIISQCKEKKTQLIQKDYYISAKKDYIT